MPTRLSQVTPQAEVVVFTSWKDFVVFPPRLRGGLLRLS